MQPTQPSPKPKPADLVRCSAPGHQQNPLHDTWILGNDGQTYCSSELGRLRQTSAPEAPKNELLMRAQREYRPGSEEWHRHFEDMISRDFYKAPVQAPNGETYDLEEISKVLTATPRFRDPRTPQPMQLPARLIPNLAVQHLAAQLGEFDPSDDPYHLPACSAQRLNAARFHFANLLEYEQNYPVASDLRDSKRAVIAWKFFLAYARIATEQAIEEGAPELRRQALQIAERAKLSSISVKRGYRAQMRADFLCRVTALALMTPLVTSAADKVGPVGTLAAAAALAGVSAYITAWPLYAATLPLEGGAGEWVRKCVLRCTTPLEARRRMNAVYMVVAFAQMGAFANHLMGETVPHTNVCAVGALMGGLMGYFPMHHGEPRPVVQPCYVAALSDA